MQYLRLLLSFFSEATFFYGVTHTTTRYSTRSVDNAGGENGYTPVVIYNIKGTSITQNERGDTDNRAVICSNSYASSMASLTKAPIIFHYGGYEVISQENQSKELYDYYWASYSRGTDGNANDPTVVNEYLSDYKSKRSKSLFDPCPYGFRTPTNGTYNLFSISSPQWTKYSYIGGAQWINGKSTWLPVTGYRLYNTGLFVAVGNGIAYRTATASSVDRGYALDFDYYNGVYLNNGYWRRSDGTTIRCIEDCDIQSDASNATF